MMDKPKGHKMRVRKGDVYESFSRIAGDIEVTEIMVGKNWRGRRRMIQYSVVNPYDESDRHETFWERYEDFENVVINSGLYILKKRGGSQ